MVEHIWSVFCRRAVVDEQTNNVSLFEIIEQISGEIPASLTPDQRPAVAIDAQLISFWIRDTEEVPEKGKARISYIGPSGDALIPPREYDIDLTAKSRVRSIGTISGLPTPESGYYRIKVELSKDDTEWTEVASIPLDVRLTVTENGGG